MEYKRNYLKMMEQLRANRESGERAISRRMSPGLAARAEESVRSDTKFDPMQYIQDIEAFLDDDLITAPETSLRPKARPEGLAGKPTRPKERPYELPDDSSRDDFFSKLIMSESSGDPNAEVINEDGNKYVGLAQFGEARLKDYKKATGAEFTQEEFKRDPKLQESVLKWHIREIDRVISQIDPEGKYDRNGLRAVAHLGGTTGMKKYVSSGGEYNPEDKFKTSLQDYYDKFSS